MNSNELQIARANMIKQKYKTLVLDRGYLDLVESWGSDERIIEAARMSTDKGFQGWGPVSCPKCDGAGTIAIQYPNDGLDYRGNPTCPKCSGDGTIAGDEKLLRYLWTHKHHTPFEMAGLTIEVQAPIMVFREWHRHRTQSFNELSARYTELPDLFYIPSIERLQNGRQSTKNKQGSQEGFSEADAKRLQDQIRSSSERCREAYELLLAQDCAREIARLVIPVNQYSRMRASANLRNWLAFLTLRLDPSAQWEIREYAQALSEIIKEKFPRTYTLFSETSA